MIAWLEYAQKPGSDGRTCWLDSLFDPLASTLEDFGSLLTTPFPGLVWPTCSLREPSRNCTFWGCCAGGNRACGLFKGIR